VKQPDKIIKAPNSGTRLTPAVEIVPTDFDPVGFYHVKSAEAVGAMIVCINRGAGWKPVRFMLPHQFYQHTLNDLAAEYPGIKAIAAFPVEGWELLAFNESDGWAKGFPKSKPDAREQRVIALEKERDELLAVCQEMVAQFQAYALPGGRQNAITQARAAIAKATGGAQ